MPPNSPMGHRREIQCPVVIPKSDINGKLYSHQARAQRGKEGRDRERKRGRRKGARHLLTPPDRPKKACCPLCASEKESQHKSSCHPPGGRLTERPDTPNKDHQAHSFSGKRRKAVKSTRSRYASHPSAPETDAGGWRRSWGRTVGWPPTFSRSPACWEALAAQVSSYTHYNMV